MASVGVVVAVDSMFGILFWYVLTYIPIAAVLCIGFESADFCLHSFTTVEKLKISVSPNDCGSGFVNRYYIINSNFIVYVKYYKKL